MADEKLNPNWGNELKAATDANGVVTGVLKPESNSERCGIVVASVDPLCTMITRPPSGGLFLSAARSRTVRL